MLDNAEDIMHSLEEFSKLKPKVIPRELEEYLGYVAKTGDPVFKWSMVKYLFREKMLSVINDFYEDTLTIELPPCPNVDAFNYDRMKTSLLERLESFHGAPFTIQRICELLTHPRKEYNRADKFMRAIEKNILVVSTREPGRFSDLDCESTQECSINGIREVGDTLDSTFIINDLGPGPDSSSTGSELNDPMPDANHLNTVERVSPVHDQEVSSDSDDSSLENGHVSVDGPAEKTNGLENEQHRSIVEEPDGTNVSSTDMSLSLEESNDMRCEEVVGNSVTSTHESVISNQQMGFVVSPNLGEVMGSVDATPVEGIEPCILPDGSLLNEVINEPQASTDKEVEKSDIASDMSKSDVLVSEKASDPAPMSSIVAVECDTSQTERSPKCDDSTVSDNSIIGDSEVSCDTNEQATPCDTTEANGTLNSGYLDSSQVQTDISPSCDVAQSDVVAQSDIVESDREQSHVIDQSDLVQTEVPADVAQTNDAAPLVSAEQSDISTHSTVIEQCDYAAQSSAVDQSDDTAQSSTVVQPNIIPSEIVAQSGDDVQSDLDQLNLAHSDSSQLNIEEQPEIDSQTADADQSVAVDQSIENDQSVDDQTVVDRSVVDQSVVDQSVVDQSVSIEQSNVIDQSVAVVQVVTIDQSVVVDQSVSVSVDQSCNVVTSGDLVPSEPMAESSINDQPESIQSDNVLETGPENQTEQIVQMEIPLDSENVGEPAQMNQPDCTTSEPMDVDE